MEHRTQSAQPAQTQATVHSTRLMLVTLLTLFTIAHTAGSPHTPYNLTWQIIDTSSGTVLNQTSQIHLKNTWYPDLYIDLLDLVRISWDSSFTRVYHFYVCPGHSRTPRGRTRDPCGGAEDYFCASWSCVSTGHIWWTPPKTNDLITMARPAAPACQKSSKGLHTPCNPVRISFTEQGKKATGWNSGKNWGIRLYDKIRLGAMDHGGLFTL
ncbi:MLV-related proviral Env polyprotein-like [Myotis daubentonii]|uniref:MLV-related proviral Env polyprotein-like n=1 Tax=Myotis daubentonii TaxID=98922 RepID=UPI0028738CE7|nr:MLV-related proviral Env polyprotein-like [Myotis daubentonii]